MVLSGSAGAGQSGDVIVVDKAGEGDFASVQTAVDHAEPGDTIELRSGNYEEDILIDVADLTIAGSGPDVIISGGFHITADGVSVVGVTIENGETTYTAQPTGISIANSTVSGEMRNNRFVGNEIHIIDRNDANEIQVILERNEFDKFVLRYSDEQLVGVIYGEPQPAVDETANEITDVIKLSDDEFSGPVVVPTNNVKLTAYNGKPTILGGDLIDLPGLPRKTRSVVFGLASGIHIDGLTLDGDGVTDSGVVLSGCGEKLHISNTTVRNALLGVGICGDGSLSNIVVEDSIVGMVVLGGDLTVEHNTITAVYLGVTIDGAQLQFRHNVITVAATEEFQEPADFEGVFTDPDSPAALGIPDTEQPTGLFISDAPSTVVIHNNQLTSSHLGIHARTEAIDLEGNEIVAERGAIKIHDTLIDTVEPPTEPETPTNEAKPTEEPSPRPDTDTEPVDQPGFGVLIGLGALFLVILLRLRY